jgi:16S rRNA (uracil1498-N3)-methyltransferase
MTTTIVVTPIEFDGTEIELHGEAYHRFVRVKRLRGGESVRVVDGEGRARRGVVARLDRARAVVALAGAEPAREPRLRVELLVAPPEPARAAWLVEKATEVGVAAVTFAATERSARSEETFGAVHLARLRRVAHAAVEQCGRSVVPELGALRPLAELVAARAAGGAHLVALDPGGGDASALCALDAGRCPGLRLALAVGPEGGFTGDELALLDAAGARRAALGGSILRVETAAVLAAGIALATFR